MTITGPGANQLDVDANFQGRVFDIAASTTVQISGLALLNGNGVVSTSATSPDDQYGGIILDRGILTLSNVLIADGGATFGGGIAIPSDAVFSASNNLTLLDTSILGSATNSSGAGAAIYDALNTASVDISITNSSFGNNTSYGTGGGIVSSAALNIVSSTLATNTGTGGSLVLTGIAASSGSTVLTDSTG